MNIIEGIESGCPFKRKGASSYWYSDGRYIRSLESKLIIEPDVEDIIANDYELAEKRIEITESMLEKAFETFRMDFCHKSDACDKVLKFIKKELGFKD